MPETGAAQPAIAISPKPARPRVLSRFLRDWMWPQWKWLLLGTIFSAISAIGAFGYAQSTATAMDWFEQRDNRVITLAPFFIVALVVVRAVALYIQTQSYNHAVQRALVHLQDALFSSLIRGDFARLHSERSGAYVSRFANDMTLIRESALRIATNFARSTLTIIACLAFMFWRDWLLAAFLLVVYPIAFYPVVRLGDRIRKTSRRAQEQVGELTSNLSEAFQGARTVKAYGLEDYQVRRSHTGFLERARLYMKILRSKALVDPLLEVVGGIAVAGIFAFAGWRAITGDATTGDLVGFITAIAVASPEVRALGTLNAVVNEGMAAADRLYATIDAPAEIADSPDAKPIGTSAGKVAFDNVDFSYDPQSPVLNGLSFTASPGETIAFVGPSGAGKSTIFNLLLRLYDPDHGVITIDTHDIRAATTASVRAQLALVSQDAFLFDASIRENIALGRPDATPEEIETAARDAACTFIDKLPGGLDAQVGEGGASLSGGQRQRVALARALLSNAPVLLLDEATSALDSDSEAKVQQALANLAGKRTVLVIAHRLATVRRADRIYVIENGTVVETGKHEELVAKSGPYARLAAHQMS